MASIAWPWEPLEPREDEPAHDPYAEQDLTPTERHYYERYEYDPERDEK